MCIVVHSIIYFFSRIGSTRNQAKPGISLPRCIIPTLMIDPRTPRGSAFTSSCHQALLHDGLKDRFCKPLVLGLQQL